jgi:hypothetical protein
MVVEKIRALFFRDHFNMAWQIGHGETSADSDEPTGPSAMVVLL